jgi:hypothetical protein
VRINPVVFTTFKWCTYALLCVNAFLFWQEDSAAAEHIYVGGVTLAELIKAYAPTIDTSAWIVLLLIFELETSVIPHEKLTGGLKWSLTAVTAACYATLFYTFYGYVQLLVLSYQFAPFAVEDACNLVAAGYSVAVDIGEFIPLTAQNCLAFAGGEIFRLGNLNIIADAGAVSLSHRLAWTDVANATAWLGVVAVLEVDVWMQLNRTLTAGFVTASKIAKVLFYGTLVACAVLWQIEGGFVDVWDAYLWLIAFVFIEMNFFEWHEEETTA